MAANHYGFLHGDFQEVYMEQQPGFQDTGHLDYVYADHSLYVQITEAGIVIITIYVDDLIIGVDALNDVEHVKALLCKQFDMKDLGELRYFLGIEMIRNEGGIWLLRKKYGLDAYEVWNGCCRRSMGWMLMKYGMADCKPISTPLNQNLKLRINEGEVLDDATMYRRIVGSLIYITISLPDLSYAIGLVGQFMQLPRKPHLDAVRHILRHARATLDLALFYDAGTQVQIHGYTDSD
ncbi:hypothetical protein L7F22_059089 [Adiantum nelumboides]|nr:hypothetical protein [Adiantum nelumboides]